MSASPRMTAPALAPASPMGTMLGAKGVRDGESHLGRASAADNHRHRTAVTLREAGVGEVVRTEQSAGRATAPDAGMPSATRATFTATITAALAVLSGAVEPVDDPNR